MLKGARSAPLFVIRYWLLGERVRRIADLRLPIACPVGRKAYATGADLKRREEELPISDLRLPI